MRLLSVGVIALTSSLVSVPALAHTTAFAAKAKRALLRLADCDDGDGEGEDLPDDGPAPCEEAEEAWEKVIDKGLDSGQFAADLENLGLAHLAHPSPKVRSEALMLASDSLTVDLLLERGKAEKEHDIIEEIVYQLGSLSSEDPRAYSAAMAATRAPNPKTRSAAIRGLALASRTHPKLAEIRKRMEEMIGSDVATTASAACSYMHRFGASAVPLLSAQLEAEAIKTERGAVVASGCLTSLVRMWATPPRIGPKAAYDATLAALRSKPRSSSFPSIPFYLYSPLEKTMMVAPYVKRGDVLAALVDVFSDPALKPPKRVTGLLKLAKTVAGQPRLVAKVSKAALKWLEKGFDGRFYDASRLINDRKLFGWGPKQLGQLHKAYQANVKRAGSKQIERDKKILAVLEAVLRTAR